MVTWLWHALRRRPAGDPAALEAFLARHSAYVAQKTVLDYCRVKVGRAEREAFADPDFQAALHHCRWQTFAATVPDVTAMVEAWLRPHATAREPALADSLAALGSAVLAKAEAPEAERPTLAAASEALAQHLARLQAGPPLPANRLPLLAEAPLFATLPIAAEQRIGESVSIKGALRFHFVSVQQELERAFDAPTLTARILD